MDKNQKRMEIVIPPSASTNYSNMAIIAHAANEFVLDFASLLPGSPNAMVNSRIIMNPLNAKKVLMALQENIQKYESVYGPIDGEPVNNNGGNLPSAPFPYGLTPKGDA